jgi:hypothetical protein
MAFKPIPRERADKLIVEFAKGTIESARGASQVVVLINGGAATALLALLSKEKIPGSLLGLAPYCLGGYALGVIAGAVMIYFTMRTLDCWQDYYDASADENEAGAGDAERLAIVNSNRVHYAFITAIVSFMISSVAVGMALI